MLDLNTFTVLLDTSDKIYMKTYKDMQHHINKWTTWFFLSLQLFSLWQGIILSGFLNIYHFPGRFDEDGSFIGQYVTVSKNKQRISNELTAAVANGATYVWTLIRRIIINIWYEEFQAISKKSQNIYSDLYYLSVKSSERKDCGLLRAAKSVMSNHHKIGSQK